MNDRNRGVRSCNIACKIKIKVKRLVYQKIILSSQLVAIQGYRTLDVSSVAL